VQFEYLAFKLIGPSPVVIIYTIRRRERLAWMEAKFAPHSRLP